MSIAEKQVKVDRVTTLPKEVQASGRGEEDNENPSIKEVDEAFGERSEKSNSFIGVNLRPKLQKGPISYDWKDTVVGDNVQGKAQAQEYSMNVPVTDNRIPQIALSLEQDLPSEAKADFKTITCDPRAKDFAENALNDPTESKVATSDGQAWQQETAVAWEESMGDEHETATTESTPRPIIPKDSQGPKSTGSVEAGGLVNDNADNKPMEACSISKKPSEMEGTELNVSNKTGEAFWEAFWDAFEEAEQISEKFEVDNRPGQAKSSAGRTEKRKEEPKRKIINGATEEKDSSDTQLLCIVSLALSLPVLGSFYILSLITCRMASPNME